MMSTPVDVSRDNFRIDGSLQLEGTLIPSDTNAFDLGTEQRRFRNIYLADPHDGVSAIHFGDYILTAQDIVNVKIMADGNTTLVKGGVNFYTDIFNRPTTLAGFRITDAATIDQGERADSVHTSVLNTSANWNSTHASVLATSGVWDQTYTRVDTYGVDWDSTHASVLATSSNWDSTHTSVNSSSASWDTTYTSVNSTSSTWDYAYQNSVSQTTNLTNIKVSGEVDTDTLKVTSDFDLGGKLLGPSVTYIDPMAHGDNTGKLVILGDLQVEGETTTINSTTTTVSGKTLNLSQGSSDAAAADDSGLHVMGADATLKYKAGDDRWIFNKNIEIQKEVSGVVFKRPSSNRFSTFGHDATGAFVKLSNPGDTFRLTGNDVTLLTGNLNSKKLGVMTTTPAVTLHVAASDAIKIPVGTTAERPTATGTAHQGYIRYNTTTDQFEGFGSGNTWGVIGGVKDRDLDTYISTESEPGEDEDYLKFYTEGTERFEITKTGDVGIDTSSNVQDKLHVAKGALRVSNNIVSNSRFNMLNLASNRSIDDYGGLDSAYWSIDLRTPFTDHRRGDLIFSSKGDVASSVLSDVFAITYSGAVGVGTSTPDYKLHVDGGAYFSGQSMPNTAPAKGVYIGKSASGESRHVSIISNEQSYIDFGTTGGDFGGRFIYSHGTHQMKFYSNSNLAMTLDNNQNLNIGVSTTTYNAARLRVDGSVISTGNTLNTWVADNVGFDMHSSTKGMRIFSTSTTSNGGMISFYVGRDLRAGDNLTPAMHIDSTSNIGIGTTSPNAKFHVSGANDTTFVNSNVTMLITGTDEFDSGNAGSGIGFVGKYNDDGLVTTFGQIYTKKENNTSGEYDASLCFGTRETGKDSNTDLEKMRITSDGNVGIGTSNPSDKLHVDGTVRATQIMCTALLGESRSSNTTVIDTTITPDMFEILEVFGRSNPNTGGSADYVDPIHMMVYRGTGYQNNEKIHAVYATQIGPMARSQFTTGSTNNGNNVDVVWVDKTTSPETETTQCPFGSTTHTLRFKLSDPHPHATPSWTITTTRRL